MKQRQTSHAQRVRMIELRQDGHTLAAIAKRDGLSFYTVRKWWRRYCKFGWDGLLPKTPGPPKTGALSRFSPLVKYVALRLKKEHPGWGLDLLLLAMSRRSSLEGHNLPGRTALYNYLQPYLMRIRPGKRASTKRPNLPLEPTRRVHERWQMDFKGDVHLASGVRVAPWLACDEHSSAPLATKLYTARHHDPRKGMSYREIQAELRIAFSRWGRPQQLRMDRDPLWVGSSRMEWPGTLLLWLVGLGIAPIINRPGRPTDNSQIERLNRTWNEHVFLGNQNSDPPALQAATEQAWRDRLHSLPSHNRHCQGRSPVTAFPELLQPHRPFSPDTEPLLFDMQQVHTYLAQWRWQRKVYSTGHISLADFSRPVSHKHAGQIVKVTYDPDFGVFVVKAIDGSVLSDFTLPIIDRDHIMGVRNL